MSGRVVTFQFKQTDSTDVKGEGDSKVYTAVASTDALDRDREILLPKGVMIENFMKNPVLLPGHQYRSTPIGKILRVLVTDSTVIMDFEFGPDEESKRYELLYTKGFMNAFSVGFLVKVYVPTYALDESVTSIDVTLPDGSVRTIDLTQYENRPYGIIPQWELLEVSAVSVPANPQALIMRGIDEVGKEFKTKGGNDVVLRMFTDRIKHEAEVLSKALDGLMKQSCEVEVSPVVPYEKGEFLPEGSESIPLDHDISSLAIACSSDGSGEKETIDWLSFSKAFAWFNVAKADTFMAYKFLHHAVQDGKLYVSKQGVFSAMASLLKQADCADRDEVYEHLKSHYQDCGLEAPAKDVTYTDAQLEQIEFHGILKWQESSSAEPTSAEAPPSAEPDAKIYELIDSKLGDFGFQLKEFEINMKVRLHVVVRLIEELHQTIQALEPAKESNPPEAVAPDKSLKELLDQLRTEISQVVI